MRLADRLRALDDQVVWVDESPTALRLTPGLALGLGLFAICLYVGWALAWGWPRALVAVLGLGTALTAVARFFFGDHAQGALGSRREGPFVHDRRAGAEEGRTHTPNVDRG